MAGPGGPLAPGAVRAHAMKKYSLRKQILARAGRYPAGGDRAGKAKTLERAAGLLPVEDAASFEECLDLLLPALEGLRDSGVPEAIQAHLRIWRRLDSLIYERYREIQPMTALFVRYRLGDACAAAAGTLPSSGAEKTEREVLRKEASDCFAQVAEALGQYVGDDHRVTLAVRRRMREMTEEQAAGLLSGESGQLQGESAEE